MKRPVVTCLGIILAVMLLVGCGKTPTLQGLALSGLPQELAVGESAELELSYQWDLDQEELGEEELAKAIDGLTIQYSTSDEGVASLEGTTVTGVAPGEATITATCGEITAQGTVTVVVPVEEISVTDLSGTVGEEPLPVEYKVTPENYTGELVWQVEDESIAALDQETMTVTFLAPGETTLTAQAPNGVEGTAAITVGEKPAPTPAAGTGAGGSSQTAPQTAASEPATGSGFETGAVPFYHSTQQWDWWGIDSSDAVYQAVADNINAMRREVGLPDLAVDAELSAIADARCEQIVSTSDFSHNGAQTPWEIIAQNYNSAASVCEAWKNSPGHYGAIINDSSTAMGIGCWFEQSGITIWCVVFN